MTPHTFARTNSVHNTRAAHPWDPERLGTFTYIFNVVKDNIEDLYPDGPGGLALSSPLTIPAPGRRMKAKQGVMDMGKTYDMTVVAATDLIYDLAGEMGPQTILLLLTYATTKLADEMEGRKREALIRWTVEIKQMADRYNEEWTALCK